MTLLTVFLFLFLEGFLNDRNEQWVHIDTFSAMNGISRFCESDFPWRYIKFLVSVLYYTYYEAVDICMDSKLELSQKKYHSSSD